jgi:excisionase family DNA binding protein
MRSELESQDIETIAQRVLELIRPVVSNNGKSDNNEMVFDVKGLAEYLHVKPSWIYKQMSLKTIPFFKTGKYSRFRKKDIDKWIESRTIRPIPHLN